MIVGDAAAQNVSSVGRDELKKMAELAADKKKDAKMLKKAGLDNEEKKEFEKKDKAHGEKKKPKTMSEDKKIDAKIIKGIKSKEKKHKACDKIKDKNATIVACNIFY